MFQEVKRRLQLMSIKELMQLSIDIDIPFPTLSGIRYGKTKDPGVSIIEKLHNHFAGEK
jgi:hypothetical protein